jgi:hypothetical protein
MTLKKDIVTAWKEIQCNYGNHEWEKPICDYHGFYHLMWTRECKNCHKIEASKKPFHYSNPAGEQG